MLMTPVSTKYFFLPNTEEPAEVLEHCLEVSGKWTWAKKLKLNPDKTEVLLNQKALMQVLDYQPALNGTALLNPERLWDIQVIVEVRGAFVQLWLMRQL